MRDERAIFTLLCGLAWCGPVHAADTTPIPDFSGQWGRNAVDFESPEHGPGPVVNLSLLPNGSRDPSKLVGDYNNPILKPAAAAQVKHFGEMSAAGTAYPTPTNQCWPEHVPYIWSAGGGLKMQMLQQRNRITIIHYFDHQVRHIYLNESHPVRVTPSAYGHSVGRYEGDTLVVDTVGVKPERFAYIDAFGTPYSDALHVVERYRLIDGEAARQAAELHEKVDGRVPPEAEGVVIDPSYSGKGLHVEITVEDPNVFTTPWSALITFRHTSGGGWSENICAENTREYYSGKDTDVPRDDTPDF